MNIHEHLGMFRFVTKQICLFRLFRYRFEKPKQTEFFVFGFTKQTEIYFCLFRGHPSSVRFPYQNFFSCDLVGDRDGEGDGDELGYGDEMEQGADGDS